MNPGTWKLLSESLELNEHKVCSWRVRAHNKRYTQNAYQVFSAPPKKEKEGAHNSYGCTWTLQLLYPSSNSPSLTTWAERTTVNTWFNDTAVSQVDRQATTGPTSSPYIIYWTIFSCLISLSPESRLFKVRTAVGTKKMEPRKWIKVNL